MIEVVLILQVFGLGVCVGLLLSQFPSLRRKA